MSTLDNGYQVQRRLGIENLRYKTDLDIGDTADAILLALFDDIVDLNLPATRR